MNVEQIGIICGIAFGIVATSVGILNFVQHYQTKAKLAEEKQAKDLLTAEQKGAHDQREKEMQREIDNAHRKIREDIMPKLNELDKSHTAINTTFEYIKISMDESNKLLKDMASNIIELGKQVAGIQGERRAEISGRTES
jgi:hypothetical protein